MWKNGRKERQTESRPGSILTAVEGVIPCLGVTAGLGVQLGAGKVVPTKNTHGHTSTCPWDWLGRSCGQLDLSRASSGRCVGNSNATRASLSWRGKDGGDAQLGVTSLCLWPGEAQGHLQRHLLGTEGFSGPAAPWGRSLASRQPAPGRHECCGGRPHSVPRGLRASVSPGSTGSTSRCLPGSKSPGARRDGARRGSSPRGLRAPLGRAGS